MGAEQEVVMLILRRTAWFELCHRGLYLFGAENGINPRIRWQARFQGGDPIDGHFGTLQFDLQRVGILRTPPVKVPQSGVGDVGTLKVD